MTTSTSIPFIPSSGGSGTTVYQTSGTDILGSLAAIVVVFALLALVGILVIVVVANRAEPDPNGRRPQAVYFFGVSFVTIIISVIGSTLVVSSLTRFIGSHASPIADSVTRAVVLGGLITVFSGTVLMTHVRRGTDLAVSDPPAPGGPSRRVAQSYVSAVSFLAVLTLLIAAIAAIYIVLAIAAPGVFGSLGGRAHAGRYLIEDVYVGLLMVLILWTHRQIVPPGLRFLGPSGSHRVRGPSGIDAGAVVPPSA